MKFENFPPKQQEILSRHTATPNVINGETGHLETADHESLEMPAPKIVTTLHNKLVKSFTSFIERSQPPEKDLD